MPKEFGSLQVFFFYYQLFVIFFREWKELFGKDVTWPWGWKRWHCPSYSLNGWVLHDWSWQGLILLSYLKFFWSSISPAFLRFTFSSLILIPVTSYFKSSPKNINKVFQTCRLRRVRFCDLLVLSGAKRWWQRRLSNTAMNLRWRR